MALPRFLYRISIRLLAFNLLLVFLPVLGILSLEVYEQQLLNLQERSMVQQGRFVAAALGDRGPLDAEGAQKLLLNMRQQFDARVRIVDGSNNLLADSTRFGPRREADAPPLEEPATRRDPLYRLGSFLYYLYARVALPPEPPLAETEFYATAKKLQGPEIQKALAGEYGAAPRPSPGQRSLTLYSALPIHSEGEVVGAVLVSKSTVQILKALYDFRLNAFKVVLASILAATVLSLLLSTTIARPIVRLSRQALALLDRRGRLRGHFRESNRRDEIGDLSRSLAELTRRLEGHIKFIESFASDVSHEFKNPLASIRNATELLAEAEDPQTRQRFLGMVLSDVARLEHLLTDVREITLIDAELEEEPAEEVDLRELLQALVESFEVRTRGRVRFRLTAIPEPLRVKASGQRLTQVFENLIENASGFSPEGGEVHLRLDARGDRALIRVADQGPGIPPEHLKRIFTRFFTYRPQSAEHKAGGNGRPDHHSGLGLSIVRAIVEGYGGEVTASNTPGGGAELTVELPCC